MNETGRNFGIFLIFVGFAFLSLQWIGDSWAQIGWPFFIIVPGAVIMFNAFKDDGVHTEQFIGGSTTLATGLILLAMSITGRWYAWSYAWGIYPIVAGAALMYAGQRNNDPEAERNGRQALTSGVYLLGGFGLFFEVFVFGGGDFFDNGWWPALLIVAGGVILLASRNYGGGKSKRKSHDDDNIYTF